LSIIIIAILFLHGCGALEDDTKVRVLKTIVVEPSSAVFAKSSGYYKFKATGYDQYGSHINIIPSWSASPEVGTINIGSGDLTIKTSSGEGKVRAYVGTIEGFATVTVTDGNLESITISPSYTTLFVGTSYPLSATGHDSLGAPVKVYPIWSLDPLFGQIDPNAGPSTTLTPTAAELIAYIIATLGSVSSSIEVVVEQPSSL